MTTSTVSNFTPNASEKMDRAQENMDRVFGPPGSSSNHIKSTRNQSNKHSFIGTIGTCILAGLVGTAMKGLMQRTVIASPSSLRNGGNLTEGKTDDAYRDAIAGWHAPVGHDGIRSTTATYIPTSAEVHTRVAGIILAKPGIGGDGDLVTNDPSADNSADKELTPEEQFLRELKDYRDRKSDILCLPPRPEPIPDNPWGCNMV